MKKTLILVITVIIVLSFGSVCSADIGDSLGDLFNNAKEEIGNGIEEISSDFKDMFKTEQDGNNSDVDINEIIGIIGDSNSKKDAALQIIAYLIDSSQYGEDYGNLSNVLRAISMLINSFEKQDKADISKSAGNLYDALMAMDDMSGYSDDTLIKMYESSRDELKNRGIITE